MLLQSLGAYIAKEWLRVIDTKVKEAGIRGRQVAWVHDEVQWTCHPDDADKLMKILEEAALEAGDNLGIRMPIEAEAKKGTNWYETH